MRAASSSLMEHAAPPVPAVLTRFSRSISPSLCMTKRVICSGVPTTCGGSRFIVLALYQAPSTSTG
jgi:hypothetical protein